MPREWWTALVAGLALVAGCGGGSGGQDGGGSPPAAEPGAVPVALQRAWPNLSFDTPIALLQAPGDASRWFVLERAGRVLSFDATNPDTVRTVLDLSAKVNTSGEGGLLGLALHPDFATNGEAYPSYTVAGPDADTPLTSIISRIRSMDGGQTLDPGSEEVILSLDQPFTNHNGGHVAFGPDGYLYIGFGDGGGGGDPLDNAQNVNNLFGALLRIDVDNGMDYGIPADNPFLGGGGAPEIYAYGLRNPWRFSFDSMTGKLWLGDVGQGSREEVDIIVNGGNYGWDCFEASLSFEPAGCGPREDYILPVAEYGRDEGRSITGGYVYRGDAIAGLQGVYVFGDFISGRIFGLFPVTGGYERYELLDTEFNIVSFGQGADGELYVVDFGGGLYRLVAGP